MSDRTYSESEIADLIARAAERQQDARRQASGPGLTLDEIERIGSETGIDPEHLRAAAAEMDTAGRTLARQSEQTRTHVVVERWIDAPLTPEAWEEAVAELQGRHGADAGFWWGQDAGGGVQQVGNAHEWRHTSGLGIQTVATASPRDGRTRLRIRQLVGLASSTTEGIGYGIAVALVPAFFALLAAIGADAPFATAALWTSLVFLAAAVVAIPAVMTLDRRWRAKKLRQVEDLADDVGALLAAPAGGAAEPAEARDDVDAGEVPARLDLDALGDAPPVDATPERRRVRE